jgi:aspartokinase-like uncharacterized kinase
MPELIVKVGGGLLATGGDLERVLAAISALAASCRLMIVPGGGPFAEAVRAVDRQVGIPEDAAHWMAVLAMDQYAHLVAARLERAVIVSRLAQARGALEAQRVPVLAPSEWLRQDDPLPHSWEVTSDSIAAWVAGASGARELVLVKPRGATGEMVDGHFARVVPRHIRTTIVRVEQVDAAFSQIAAGVPFEGT